jgi:hypothetical protein
VTTSLLLACLWALAATGIALAPRRFHWPGAVVLMVAGVPVIVLVGLEHGALVALLMLAAAASVLRWPLRYLGRWLAGRIGR